MSCLLIDEKDNFVLEILDFMSVELEDEKVIINNILRIPKKQILEIRINSGDD